MLSLIITALIAILSFIGGLYYEKSNSIKKIKPLKDAFSKQNTERTIITGRDEPYKHTDQEIKDMFKK